MEPRIANWGIIRPFIKVGKLNKTLTIPTFSQRCGTLFKCLYSGSTTTPGDGGILDGDVPTTDYTTAFTVEAWIKCFGAVSGSVREIVCHGSVSVPTENIGLRLNGSNIECLLRLGGLDNTRTSTGVISEGQWTHVCATYDNSNVRLYINGELDLTSALVGPLDAPAGQAGYLIGASLVTASRPATNFVGKLGQIIFRNIALGPEAVRYQYNKHRNTIVGDTTDDEIKVLYTTYGEVKEEISGDTLVPGSLGIYSFEDDAPPIGYGASFVPIQFSVIANEPHSLKFPVIAPTDANFGLHISWTDDNGTVQRRRLFDPEVGELDISPTYAEYNGEELPEEYTFEIWNIDTAESVDLAEEIEIDTSILTNPQNSVDHTQIVLATPTERTALYEPFPLTGFPLAFDNEQTDWI